MKGLSNPSNIMRNPKQMLNNLQSMVDPKIMAQLGGAGNLLNMVKEMGSNPEMQKMMSAMGGGDMAAMMKKGGKGKR